MKFIEVFRFTMTLAVLSSFIPFGSLSYEKAFAKNGVGAGGGGGAFVCIDPLSGEVLSAQSQDLWRAAQRRPIGLELNPKIFESVDYKNIAREAVSRLSDVSERFKNHVSGELDLIFAGIEAGHILDEVKIVPTGDDQRRFEKSICAKGKPDFAQAAYYNDDESKLTIAAAVWDAFDSETDRAGLITHEAVYRVLRKRYKAKDSVRAQNITGRLFSEEALPEHGDIPNPCISAKENGRCMVSVTYNGINTDSFGKALSKVQGKVLLFEKNYSASNSRKKKEKQEDMKLVNPSVLEISPSFNMTVPMGFEADKRTAYFWATHDEPVGKAIKMEMKIGEEVIFEMLKTVEYEGRDHFQWQIKELNTAP